MWSEYPAGLLFRSLLYFKGRGLNLEAHCAVNFIYCLKLKLNINCLFQGEWKWSNAFCKSFLDNNNNNNNNNNSANITTNCFRGISTNTTTPSTPTSLSKSSRKNCSVWSTLLPGITETSLVSWPWWLSRFWWASTETFRTVQGSQEAPSPSQTSS